MPVTPITPAQIDEVARLAEIPPVGSEERGKSVSLADLHAANIARQAEWCAGGDPEPDLAFRGNELAGETGEACNVIKKLERERYGWRGSRASLDDLAEELADVVICADLCAVTAGIDLAAAVVAKFNATSEKVGLTTRLTLMSEVRRMGQRDVLSASASPSGHSRAEPSGLGPAAECPSRGAELERLSAAATPGPWAYRPEHLDDWGYIRSTVIDNPVLKGKVVATTRGDGHETFDAHREAGTDPYEPNGRFIVALVNAYRAGELVPAFAAANPSGGTAWTSVEDQLPGEQGQDSEEVIVFLSGHCELTDMECRKGAGWGHRFGFFDAERQCFRVHGRPDYSVTHWMPKSPSPLEQAASCDGSAEGGETGTGSTEGNSAVGLQAETPEVTPSIPPSPRKGQEENPCPLDPSPQSEGGGE